MTDAPGDPRPPVFAPPSAPQYYAPQRMHTPPPPPATPKPRKSWVVPVIVASVVVLLGGFVATALWTGRVVAEFVLDNEVLGPQPAATGDPGDPRARETDECDTPCFTGGSADDLVATDVSLRRLGLPVAYSGFGDYPSTSPLVEFSRVSAEWVESGSEPNACFFASFATPVAGELGDDVGGVDPIHYIGEYTDVDELDYLQETVRVFENSDAAVDHMVQLDRLIAGCSGFTYTDDDYMYETELNATPAFDVPANVAAIAWTETYAEGTYTVVDIQRANLVVRSTFWTSGGTSDRQFRKFITSRAEQLAELPRP